MESDVKIFEPNGNAKERIDELIQMKTVIEKCRNNIDGFNINLEMLEKEIEKEKGNYYGRYQELLDYLSTLWGKYVNLKICYKFENKWIVENEYNVFLTDFVPTNSCLFGIYNEPKNPYNASFHYACINLKENLSKHRLVFEEITKEQFIKEAKEGIENCLKYRLDKINGGNYVLTLNGYKSNNNG